MLNLFGDLQKGSVRTLFCFLFCSVSFVWWVFKLLCFSLGFFSWWGLKKNKNIYILVSHK